VLGLVAYLPYSKLLHVLLSIANLFMRRRVPIGVAALIDFEDERIESYGVSSLSELPRKTLFDSDACLRCGRCQDACPATQSGKHLNPKAAVQDIRAAMEAAGRGVPDGPDPADAAPALAPALVGDVVPEKDLWSCTTCRACEQACPIFVGHVDKTLEMRRNLVLMESRFPGAPAVDNLEVNANPPGRARCAR
jgi:ferredoxin